MKRILFAVLPIIALVSCEKDPRTSDYTAPYNLQIDGITSITETTADITVSVDCNSNAHSDIYAILSNGEEWFVGSLTGGGTLTETVTGLKSGTSYEVKVKAMPGTGSTLYSETVSFKTKSPVSTVTLTVPTTTLTSTKYSSTGFTVDGTKYDYKYAYYVTFTWNLTGYQLVQNTAVLFDDGNWWGYKNLTHDGSYSKDMILFSNTTSCSSTYCSYAILKDGTEKKSSYATKTFYYGSKGAITENDEIKDTDGASITVGCSFDGASPCRGTASEEK